MKKKFLRSIRAVDRPGQLHLLTGLVNHKLMPIISQTAVETDIHGIILVAMEVKISDCALTPLILKFENRIDMFVVDTHLLVKAIVVRSALFELHEEFLAPVGTIGLAKYNVKIDNVADREVSVSYSGRDIDIQRLHTVLDCSYLLDSNRYTPQANWLIARAERSRVIIRLAA